VGDAGGNVDVEGVDVKEATLPGDFFAVGGEMEANEGGDRAVGAVLARDPLGVVESERARADGDDFFDVEDFVRGVGGVDCERDRAGLGLGGGNYERESESREKKTMDHACSG